MQAVVCALLTALLAFPPSLRADGRQADGRAVQEVPRPSRGDLEESQSLVRGPIPIRAPRIGPDPAAGQGRLSIAFEGNRRWCTFPDDRLQDSVTKEPSGPKGRRDVYTFGYQFSIAAVEPARPDTTHLLYLSPEIETASLRQAGKLGRGTPPGRTGARNPIAIPDDQGRPDPSKRETPATLVPYWDEAQRCALVEDRFDFDLAPGVYDLYISFDIKIRSGAWVHRSYDYLSGVEVREGERTLVGGFLEMRGGGHRDLRLRTASIESPAPEGTAGH